MNGADKNHQLNKAMSQFNFLRLNALLLAMTSTLMLSVGCGRQLAEQRPSPPVVTVAPVERQELVEWDEFTGRTEPVESVEVRPRVSGYIQEVRFQSGQLVKKGENVVLGDIIETKLRHVPSLCISNVTEEKL